MERSVKNYGSKMGLYQAKMAQSVEKGGVNGVLQIKKEKCMKMISTI